MVDELNEAAGALWRANDALKEAARLDDRVQAMFDANGPTLRLMANNIMEYRCQWVAEEEEGGH